MADMTTKRTIAAIREGNLTDFIENHGDELRKVELIELIKGLDCALKKSINGDTTPYMVLLEELEPRWSIKNGMGT